MEYLDILDQEGNKTGKTETHEAVHQKGLFHRTVHVWIMNKHKEMLIQKRSKMKKAHPGLWDISVAGHISAGQTSLEAAIRETKEEIGVDLEEKELKYLFSLEERSLTNGGTLRDNEFQDIYIVHKDVSETDIVVEPAEVEAVKFLSLPTFKEWIEGSGEPMVEREDEYRRLLESPAVRY